MCGAVLPWRGQERPNIRDVQQVWTRDAGERPVIAFYASPPPPTRYLSFVNPHAGPCSYATQAVVGDKGYQCFVTRVPRALCAIPCRPLPPCVAGGGGRQGFAEPLHNGLDIASRLRRLTMIVLFFAKPCRSSLVRGRHAWTEVCGDGT